MADGKGKGDIAERRSKGEGAGEEDKTHTGRKESKKDKNEARPGEDKRCRGKEDVRNYMITTRQQEMKKKEMEKEEREMERIEREREINQRKRD